jgi:hypothetical protein
MAVIGCAPASDRYLRKTKAIEGALDPPAGA